MKKIIFLIIASLTVNYASSQITKGFWMFGGNGSLSSNNIVSPLGTIKSTLVYIQPKVGVFLFDKLATGIIVNYELNRSKNSSIPVSSTSTYGIGSFIRYYLLEKDNRLNLLTELNGVFNRQTGVNNSNSGLIQYSILTGPVIFLNSSIALEILTGYRRSNETKSEGSYNNEFLIQIGLQIHLEKDR